MMIMFDDNEIDMYRSIFNILYNMEIAQEVALSIMHDITMTTMTVHVQNGSYRGHQAYAKCLKSYLRRK